MTTANRTHRLTAAEYEVIWHRRKAAGLVVETTSPGGRWSRQSFRSIKRRDSYLERARRLGYTVTVAV